MTCDYYSVLYEDIVIARGMTIETAMTLVQALFQKFQNEVNVRYTIMKEPACVVQDTIRRI